MDTNEFPHSDEGARSLEQGHRGKVEDISEKEVIEILSEALESEYEFQKWVDPLVINAVYKRLQAEAHFALRSLNSIVAFLWQDLGAPIEYLITTLGGEPDFLKYRDSKKKAFRSWRAKEKMVNHYFKQAIIKAASKNR